KDFRERCIAAGRVVEADSGEPIAAPPPAPPDLELTDLEQRWNDFSAEWTKSPPEEEQALARLLQSAIELVSHELPSCSFETRRSGRLLTVHAPGVRLQGRQTDRRVQPLVAGRRADAPSRGAPRVGRP